MRRVILASLVALGFVAVPTALAGGSCTITGTSGDDFLPGTIFRDVICARRGEDTLVANGGRDLLLGGRGADRLFAVDEGNDVLKGGPGRDQCFGDEGDRFRGCEEVHR